MKDLVIVACIPAYNEEHRLAQVLEKTKKHVNHIIVCDDGSSDNTVAIAESYNAIVIQHETNKGYGAALKSLFETALKIKSDIIVTLDSDGQHNPDDIPRLVSLLLKNKNDLVIGSRFIEEKSNIPEWRKAGIEIINKISANGSEITDTQSGFRAYTKHALKILNLSETGMGISTEILLKAQKRDLSVGEIPIVVEYFEGSSTHNPVLHGLSVVLSSLRHITVKEPFVYIGIPYILTMILFNVILLGRFMVFKISMSR